MLQLNLAKRTVWHLSLPMYQVDTFLPYYAIFLKYFCTLLSAFRHTSNSFCLNAGVASPRFPTLTTKITATLVSVGQLSQAHFGILLSSQGLREHAVIPLLREGSLRDVLSSGCGTWSQDESPERGKVCASRYANEPEIWRTSTLCLLLLQLPI